jgi:hypothetical protein
VHFFPARQGGQSPPPQSTDVSLSFKMSSKHVAGVGDAEGDAVGETDGELEGSGVG